MWTKEQLDELAVIIRMFPCSRKVRHELVKHCGVHINELTEDFETFNRFYSISLEGKEKGDGQIVDSDGGGTSGEVEQDTSSRDESRGVQSNKPDVTRFGGEARNRNYRDAS